MNREQFEGSWHQFKGKMKEKWGKLTDDDIAQINGKYEQFLGKMQKRYGYSKERAEKEIHEWRLESHSGSSGFNRFEERGHNERTERNMEQKDPWAKDTWKKEGNNENRQHKHENEREGNKPGQKKEWKDERGGDDFRDKKRKAG